MSCAALLVVAWWQRGRLDWRRDVVPLSPVSEVRTLRRFRDMAGTKTVPSRYVMHCHNVVHEDHAMMIRWDIVPK